MYTLKLFLSVCFVLATYRIPRKGTVNSTRAVHFKTFIMSHKGSCVSFFLVHCCVRCNNTYMTYVFTLLYFCTFPTESIVVYIPIPSILHVRVVYTPCTLEHLSFPVVICMLWTYKKKLYNYIYGINLTFRFFLCVIQYTLIIKIGMYAMTLYMFYDNHHIT